MNKEKNTEDIDEMIEKIESFNYDFVSKTRLIMNYPITMTVDNDTHDAIMRMLKEYKKVLKEKKEYKNMYETERLDHQTEKESWTSVVLGLKNEVENLKQKLKKENEELKEIKRQKLDEYLHNNLWICKDLAQNYIHKPVIENKLAEAEKKYREIQLKKYRDAGISENRAKAKIEAYKELLKKEREEE